MPKLVRPSASVRPGSSACPSSGLRTINFPIPPASRPQTDGRARGERSSSGIVYRLASYLARSTEVCDPPRLSGFCFTWRPGFDICLSLKPRRPAHDGLSVTSIIPSFALSDRSFLRLPVCLSLSLSSLCRFSCSAARCIFARRGYQSDRQRSPSMRPTIPLHRSRLAPDR